MNPRSTEIKPPVGPEAASEATRGAASPPGGLAAVARRISSRTTDLVVIGVIFAAALSFGREIIGWWRSPPPTTAGVADAASAVPGWEGPGGQVTLEFGDRELSLLRQTISGDRDDSVAALVKTCRTAAETAAFPQDNPEQAEQVILEKIVDLEPVAQESGAWAVYEIEDLFSTVVAVRESENGVGGRSSPARRLVCWGFAVPASDREWTLYSFQPAATKVSSTEDMPALPVPPQGRRTLALRDEHGGALIGVRGPGIPEAWRDYFDEWFVSRGWEAGDGWVSRSGSWSASFRKSPDAGSRVDVQFSADGHGSLAGLIYVTP